MEVGELFLLLHTQTITEEGNPFNILSRSPDLCELWKWKYMRSSIESAFQWLNTAQLWYNEINFEDFEVNILKIFMTFYTIQ